MKASLQWWAIFVLTALGIGIAGWQGWITLAIQWGTRLLSWQVQVPAWGLAAVAILVLLGVSAWRLRHPHHPRVPRETIRVVAQSGGQLWHMGSSDDRPAMQVVSRWFITNITDEPIRLVGTRLTRLIRPRADGHIIVRHPRGTIFGPYEIPPRFTTEASADFWVQPPLRRAEQDFRAMVTIIDQFGNQHKVKNVLFRGTRPATPQRAQAPKESIHAIADPVEKQLAAVLKDEVNRYRQVGRSAGGLGSIQTRYRGHVMTALGTEWRRVDSPESQSIVPDPPQAAIESDNATALLNLYHGLGTDDERLRFVNTLLRRLSRGTEYAPIGYLILLVLFRIGRLPDALRTARRDLQGDGETGFSDFMRLLDGLLRFEHPAFTQELLDDAERFIEGIEEHTFNIRERIAAIGAFRLAPH